MTEAIVYDECEHRGDHQAGLLFAFTSVAYAVAAKALFPAAYISISSFVAADAEVPDAFLSILNPTFIADHIVQYDAVGLAFALLGMWVAYFWLIAGIRSARGGAYSVRALAFDLMQAMILYSAAERSQERPADAIWIVWLLLCGAALTFVGRYAFALAYLVPPIDPVSRLTRRRWLQVALVVTLAIVFTGALALMAGTWLNPQIQIRGAYRALLASIGLGGLLCTLVIWILSNRSRRSNPLIVRNEFWVPIAQSAVPLYFGGVLTALVAAGLCVCGSRVCYERIVQWSSVLPLSFVLYPSLFVAIFVIWVRGLRRLRERDKDELARDLLPNYQEQLYDRAPDVPQTLIYVVRRSERTISIFNQGVEGVLIEDLARSILHLCVEEAERANLPYDLKRCTVFGFGHWLPFPATVHPIHGADNVPPCLFALVTRSDVVNCGFLLILPRSGGSDGTRIEPLALELSRTARDFSAACELESTRGAAAPVPELGK
jgi:hypothetical protein